MKISRNQEIWNWKVINNTRFTSSFDGTTNKNGSGIFGVHHVQGSTMMVGEASTLNIQIGWRGVKLSF